MKRRLLAAVMAVCLMAQTAGLDVLPVNAQTVTEKTEDAESTSVAEETKEADSTYTADEKEETEPASTAGETGDTEPASTAQMQEGPITEEKKLMEPEEGVLNFVYLEEENVILPGEQKILISAGPDDSQVTSADLYYHRAETGEALQAMADEISENAMLFSLSYVDENQSGAYILDKVIYTDEQGKRFFVDLNTGKEITYGVNQEVENDPDAVVLDDEIEMDVVIFDEDGNQESELSISDALNNVESTKIQAYANARAAASSSMVIVLDPGHGGSDPGAARIHNGVRYYERDIVLKIAQFCKTELETYGGVKVYMTRTDNTSALMDRRQRTDFALSKGANVVISFHINSTGENVTAASGSLVYGPNNDTASGAVSQKLANKILEKLAKLGLKNRGIVVDEGLGMIKYPKESGLPGILIEHAFVNNPSDVANYLSSDQKLKSLGVADATAIAEYYKLKKKSGYQVYKEGAGSITAKANKAKTKYTVTVSKVPKAYGVRYAVWSALNGQDDLKWYNAKLDDKDWKGSFSISSFKHTGTYHIHAYTVNENGSTVFAAATTITVKGPSVKKVTAKSVNVSKGTFQVVATGITSDSEIQKVQMKVYSQSNKKDSYTYTAKLQKDGSYKASVNIKNHNYNFKKYTVQVYVTDANGIKKRVKTLTQTLKKPSMGLIAKANRTQTKYTITGNEFPGVKSVQMAVWSEKKGQDDLIWYTAKQGEDGIWKAVANIAKHKTAGKYYVHVYGSRASGGSIFLDDFTFQVTAPSIKKVETKKVNKTAGTCYVYVSGITAKAGVKKVSVKAWTKADKSDSHTYTATLQKDGSYRAKINKKYHKKHKGTYTIQAYVTDQRGITALKKTTWKLK